MTLRSAVALACFAAMLTFVGCTPPSVTTTSYFNAQVGTTTAPTADPTAQTTIDADSGDATGCFADGGPQPLSPPAVYGWYAYGTSPLVGQCNFPGFADSTWFYIFYSAECAGTGQNPQWSGYLTGNNVQQTVCTIPDYDAPAASSHFAIAGSLPSTITINASGLTTTYGMPQLLVFNSVLALAATVNASSVASGGTSATFPFPSLSSGGMYMLAVKNLGASGAFSVVDTTYLNVGTTTALAGAFGIDAGDATQVWQICNNNNCTEKYTDTYPLNIVTQYYADQVAYTYPYEADGIYKTVEIPVGSMPVAVKLYGSYQETCGAPRVVCTMNAPTNAIVVNSGSNTVSVINLKTDSSTAINVGTKPMSVILNSASTFAYVSNYTSGTLSEINLSTLAVSRTATVGAGLLSVAMDPSGSYVWVGGSNYLYEVSLSSFSVVKSVAVSGSVTSLAASNAQNELVYTLVENCCSSSSSYVANELQLSNLNTPGSYANAAATPYAPYTMNGTLPSAATSPTATTVSAQFGNGVAASSTPTGFVIYDVVSHQQLMTGSTPTPVRGIASDPANTVVYFTVPDSNEYISVPMP
jgi:YVTN family beta-propeller protein